MKRKPNILFLMTDQHRWDCLGCINPIVKTPHLDTLAARGTRFEQAVCNAPMCMPSRYSMMTGLYPSQSGARHNTNLFSRDEDSPTEFLPEMLRKAGYQTAGFGKTHWYERQAGCDFDNSARGFEIRYVARGADSEEREQGCVMFGDEEPQNWDAYRAETAPYGAGQESVDGYRGRTSAIAAENFPEGWLTRKALSFLKEDRDESRPFFLYLSFDKPHAAFNVPEGYEELYNTDEIAEIPQPPWLGVEDEPATHAGPDRRTAAWMEMNCEQRRLTTLRYYALCSFIDDCFGQVIKELESQGELDNTHIVFLSDHGEMLSERGYRFSKYCFYEGSVRVPIIYAGPAISAEQHNTVDSRYVELVDVLPTLRDLADLEGRPELPGRSILQPGHLRFGGYCEMHGKGYERHQKTPAVMWRTKDWKLILSLDGFWAGARDAISQPLGELFNLTEDPNEWVNCYDDPSCLEIRESLTRDLLMHLVYSNAAWPHIPGRPDLTQG